MNKEFFANSFCAINQNAETQSCEFKWFPESEKMTLEQYKEIAFKQVNAIEDLSAKLLFVDARNFFFVLVPEVQEWIDQEFTPRLLEAGLEKMAVLLPESFFSQVAAEQLLEEENFMKLEQQYFGSEDEALKWLGLN